MTDASTVARQLDTAVLQKPAHSVTGLNERLFARLFEGLVYAQIWEDPVADLEAMDLHAGADMICIASGGCNVMSYLTADPASITAVDLSPAHIALLHLKIAAAQHLSETEFHDLFVRADRPGNPALIARLLPHLDPKTRAYWTGRKAYFARGFYRQGLLGRFIGAVHVVAKLARVDFQPLLDAPDMAAQRAFYDTKIAPLFDKKLVQVLARQRASLFGLGIPPAQYDKLANDGAVIDVLRERVRRLVCDFPARDNYFLWQAVNRGYQDAPGASVPPYLEPRHFGKIAARVDRVVPLNLSLTDHLATRDAGTLDAYVLLDAQDWMIDAQLTALWDEISRTARPGARVLFRTGGTDDILPGRVPLRLLAQWHYDINASARAFARDRSAIYGGVHLYRFKG
ncbi:MAG: BtaA family protein [Rhodobacteraceae bacterium]|nr:BtaA family protein [Paracoccaceae bacterium]